MHTLEKIRDMLMDELDHCAEKDSLSTNSLYTVDKLTHAVKSIDTILAMEDSGYSNDYSYRGRKRDSMGRYSRNSYRGGSYNRGGYRNYDREYSRDDAKADLMEQLRDMSMTADGDHKMMIDEWIRQVESR